MPPLAECAIVLRVSGLASPLTLITSVLSVSVRCLALCARAHTHTHTQAGGQFNGAEGLEWFRCCDALKLNKPAHKNMLRS